MDEIPEQDKENFASNFSYIIGSEISRGNMGVIHDGIFGDNAVPWVMRERFHSIPGRKFAVKYADIGAGDKEQMRVEANIIIQLDHPNIIDIYSVITLQEHRIYLFMEFADKGDLYDYLFRFGEEDNDPKVDETQSRLWCTHMLLGLNYMLDNNVVHADLHAGNILLVTDLISNQIIAKIADLGTVATIQFGHQLTNEITQLASIFNDILCKTNIVSINAKHNSLQLIRNMRNQTYRDYNTILADPWIASSEQL